MGIKKQIVSNSIIEGSEQRSFEGNIDIDGQKTVGVDSDECGVGQKIDEDANGDGKGIECLLEVLEFVVGRLVLNGTHGVLGTEGPVGPEQEGI